MAMVFLCPCLWSEAEEVRVLDYRHCSLAEVPTEVFNYERTLEELWLDSNQIRDLPRPLFHCHGLCKLGLGDNDIHSLPPAIASLISLEELDISKNGILDIPDNIKGCKCLRTVDASINPLGKLPSGFTLLVNLEELYLNDTFLEFLPANFGRLSKLKILELRENHLKTLPKSMARLTELTRLDIGQNDFAELPDVVGSLAKLVELWCDSNRIVTIPPVIGNLRRLSYLDASRNSIETLPQEMEFCQALTDLTLTGNCLKQLPDSLGSLKNLCTLRLDDNRLTHMPSIASLVSLEELIIGQNDLTHLPHSIGLLRKLHFLNLDDNLLEELPPELGSCIGLTIFSTRGNRLTSIPDELGHIFNLRIMNLCDNFIKNLPFSITKLRNLQALWLSENQNKPLIPLQSDIDIDTGQRVLTCFILPQASRNENTDAASHTDDKCGCGNKSERRRQPRIKFSFDEELERPGRLVRAPTPYPKELKAHAKHAKNLALKYREMSVDIPSNAQIAAVPKTPSMATVLEVSVPPIATSERRIRIKEAKVTKSKGPVSPLQVHDKNKEIKGNKKENEENNEEMSESGKLYRRDLGSFPGCWKTGKGHNRKILTPPNLHRMKPSRFPIPDHSSSLPELAARDDPRFMSRTKCSMSEWRVGRKTDIRNGTESDHEMYANLVNRQRGKYEMVRNDGYRSDNESFRVIARSVKERESTANKVTVPRHPDSPENTRTQNISGDTSPQQAKRPSPSASPYREPVPFLPPRKKPGSTSSLLEHAAYFPRVQSQQLPLPLPPRRRLTPPSSPVVTPRQGSPVPALPPRDRTPRGHPANAHRPFGNDGPGNVMRKPPPYHVAAALSRRLANDPPPLKMHRNAPPLPSPTWPPPREPVSIRPSASPSSSPQHRRRHTDPSTDSPWVEPITSRQSPLAQVRAWSSARRSSLTSLHRAPSLEDPVLAQRSPRGPYPSDVEKDAAFGVYASPSYLRRRMSPTQHSASAPSTPPGADHLPPYRNPPIYPQTVTEPRANLSNEQLHQIYAGHPVPQTSRPSSFSSVSTATSQGTNDDRASDRCPLTPAKPTRVLRECFGSDRRTNKEPALGLSGIFTARPAVVEYSVPTVGTSGGIISRLAGELRSKPEALVFSNPYASHEACDTVNSHEGPSKAAWALPQQQMPVRPAWLFGQHKNPHVMPVVIQRNPDLGFSISEGSSGKGIYVCSVTPDGPASSVLKPGDKLLLVDGMDFTRIGIERALVLLEDSGASVFMMISR